ncbi:MAG: arylamine N-acetyltransferase [Nakamurella sp.]
MDDERRGAYLERINHSGSTSPDLPTLAALQRAHLLAVPFENLDIHLGRWIELDIDAIIRKIVNDRRGGFCYELNGGFAELLRALGYQVTMLEARVSNDGTAGVAFDHLALAVVLGSDRYLADVGFGAFSDEPLALDSRTDQQDSAGVFRIADRGDGWLDVFDNDVHAYRFSPIPHRFADFQAGCSYHQTAASHFTTGTVCSLRTPRGRVTISGLTLTETVDGVKSTTGLTSAELGPVLTGQFGIVLDDEGLAGLSKAPKRTVG